MSANPSMNDYNLIHGVEMYKLDFKCVRHACPLALQWGAPRFPRHTV
jgi:hypothetical protein